MTFEEHLQNHRRSDGTYDVAAAEADRADEIAEDEDAVESLARKAAQAERKAWENRERDRRLKQFSQPPLSPELDLELKIPLGDAVVVDYGDMNLERIRLRKDLRTKSHLDEIRAFETEMQHWLNTESVLPPGSTIREVL